MYKLQLIRKYLRKRRIAWVALVAVTLCTFMVLVVVSVMGGWLRMFENSFHGMTGDVSIEAESLGGFPQYQEMIDGIKKLPEVEAAVPIIRTGALINIDNIDVRMVQVLGYPPDIGTVNDWPSTLHLNVDERKKQLQAATTQPDITPADRDRLKSDIRQLPFSLHPDVPYEYYVDRNKANARNRPGIIVSSILLGLRDDKTAEADELLHRVYHYPVTLTMVPVVGGEPISMESVTPVPFWIVDDSKSRLWQMDKDNVYISFDVAQKYLRMAAIEAKPATDTDPGTDAVSARCSEVDIKAKPGVDLNSLKDKILTITNRVRSQYSIPPWYDFKVETWVEQQGTFIKAVQNEVLITTALFGIISMVAVLLILCIFYMIVAEKTKDIGIIKSVGATGTGIMNLFLGYGLAIGVVGATLGFIFAFFFMKYINPLHAWLGRMTGHPIFTPETYQFDTLPSQMDTKVVVYVVVFAILSAVVGALIPALRAAVMNPVDALRYE